MDVKYQDYLMSDEWEVKRERVLTFWKHRCALCYSDIDINVHHRTYERLGHELLTDLIPLCAECHKNFHAGGRSGAVTIQDVLAQVGGVM